MSSDYRLSPALCVRIAGLALVGAGVLVFAVALLTGLLQWPREVLLVVALTAVAVVAVGMLAIRRAVVVRLGEAGYRVRGVRGVGVASAAWTDVDDVRTVFAGGHPVVVLALKNGGTTTVPVNVLAGSPDSFVRDLQSHLDRGHGYRRLG